MAELTYRNCTALSLLWLITGIISTLSVTSIKNEIYQRKPIQSGYVASRNLKVDYPDLDKNGERETRMTVNGIEYLLREVDGKPVLSEYDVKPRKVTTSPAVVRFKD